MTVLRRLRRPRWLVATGVVAVAVPAIFLVSGVTASGKPPAVSSATPVVDRDYIYGQLFDMSYSDVYRVSGADGDPRNANDPFNLPPTVNGWQEFFQHWKQQLTDKKQMTDLAKYATVSDHYFHRLPEQRTNPNYSFDPNFRWDSDDAEVTIPGATCPGQRVLLAAHPDGTPVTPDDRRRGQQPDGLDERRQRLRRRAQASHAQQHRERRRLRRHVGRRADDGRVPGAPALVRREPHVPVEDAEGRAARRIRRPCEGRDVPARGLEVLRDEPHPARAAGPVRDVRGDERERDELPRVPPRHAVLLEQHRERRRRSVAHVHHRHAVGAELALSGHGPARGREHRGQQRRDLAVRHAT